MSTRLHGAAPADGAAAHPATWVVVPTYNEIENLEALVWSLFLHAPHVRVLVVDDNSPDGTGELADRLAADDGRVSVLHRSGKEGLGVAYRAGMRHAMERGAEIVVQMDCDFSHHPSAVPSLLDAIAAGADLVLGTRYIPGGGTENWSIKRRLISRLGTLTARSVLLLPYHDLTGGFKAWRAALLRGIDIESVEASGYGFQIETTWRAHKRGAHIVEVPIVFRERTQGVSKMNGGIVGEALLMLLRLRVHRLPSAPAIAPAPDPAPVTERVSP
jgi:dolichol-phosphate mannosyltransferase